MSSVFLTAEWRHLLMLNYEIEPVALKAFVPVGTELDYFAGKTFVSIVGFRFLNTRVRGFAVPLHRNFEEVNLRFYVRRRAGDTWRHGVVFVREFVPRRAIAFVARAFYGEPYTALPMKHRIETSPRGLHVEYSWQRNGEWESISACGIGDPKPIQEGSFEQFITEHYWGYTARRKLCNEYQVEHPVWRVSQVEQPTLNADVEHLYGSQFVQALSEKPASAFVADGSVVRVRRGNQLSAEPALRTE